MFVLQVKCYRVNQCACVISVPGMHYHAGWFVDNHQVVVFINNIEGNILRENLQFPPRTIHHNSDDIQWFNLVARFYGDPVHQNTSGIGSLLDPVS
ncbi:hypothetical protein SDC9_120375 [bioreactor metagenome]|uniref:Uncharacterized protein n=1 Tax=bioreactor metagenome TaxID=1076179 RepID=A0A645C739_9ZZZZ